MQADAGQGRRRSRSKKVKVGSDISVQERAEIEQGAEKIGQAAPEEIEPNRVSKN